MGLFKKIAQIFGRTEVEEPTALESMDADEQGKREEEAELNHHLGQIVDITYELEDQKREYELVTMYFSDIQRIEQMEPGRLKNLEEDARRILMLEENRRELQHMPKRLSGERYKLLMRLEGDIPEALKRLEELETMRGKIKRDLEYLEGEKGALRYEEEELQKKQKTLRNSAIVVGILAAITIIGFLVLSMEYQIELTIPGAAIAIVAMIAEFLIFASYSRAETERKLCYRKHNRAILLQNKVKIKWLNNTNSLDYLYAKFEVNTQKELAYDWEEYQAMVAEEEQYQRNTGDLRVYQEELLDILQDAGVRDADIWLKQLAALVDKREMVEVKHSLNVRRQKLREGMKSNEEQRQNSFTCVKGILTEYPELKEQAKEVLTSYHIAV